MSLKAFHIAFIVSSIILSAFFAGWCFQEYASNMRAAFLTGGVGGMVAGTGLIFYLLWFVKKLRTMQTLVGISTLLVGMGLSPSVLACAVCVGDSNSVPVQSANAAILFLLVVISTVLTAFGSLFLIWRKRALNLPHL